MAEPVREQSRLQWLCEVQLDLSAVPITQLPGKPTVRVGANLGGLLLRAARLAASQGEYEIDCLIYSVLGYATNFLLWPQI